jgi:hypothetical protein
MEPPEWLKQIEKFLMKIFMKDNMSPCDVPTLLAPQVIFATYFWKTLWHLLSATLKFSSACNPQFDGQTKVVNLGLGNLLRLLVGEHVETWVLILPRADFTYDSSVTRSTGLSPLEVVLDCQSHPLACAC